MEELSSIANLDKQVYDDARKKANKILQKAEAAIAETKSAWDEKIKQELERAHAQFESDLKKYSEEIEARLTLDKRRAQWKVTEDYLQNTAHDFLRQIDAERRARFVSRVFRARLDECFEGDTQKITEALAAVKHTDDAITLEMGDIAVRASAEDELEAVLLEKRAELVGALFGGESGALRV